MPTSIWGARKDRDRKIAPSSAWCHHAKRFAAVGSHRKHASDQSLLLSHNSSATHCVLLHNHNVQTVQYVDVVAISQRGDQRSYIRSARMDAYHVGILGQFKAQCDDAHQLRKRYCTKNATPRKLPIHQESWCTPRKLVPTHQESYNKKPYQ